MTGYTRAFSTLGCPEFSLAEALALAAKHGLGEIEVRALGGTVDLPAYFAAHCGTPAALAGQVRASGVRIVALDTSFKLIGSVEADRALLAANLPWAEALGGVRLRVFDGGVPGGGNDLAPAFATLEWWRAEQARHGWRSQLMVETHDALTTTPSILEFVRQAPDCGVLWDTHHTWKKGGEDPLATWAAIKDRVVHVHVKDSVSRPSARHPFTYVLPGEGEFPMPPIAAVLGREFRGTVSLEWEKQWHPYLPPVDEALRVAAERSWW